MPRTLLIYCLFFGLPAVPAIGQQGTNIYVVDFTTRGLEKNALTSKFTHEFEQALVQSGCYKVLESRDFSRLLTEVDRERAIADIAQLSDAAVSNLKTQEAEMVVFGEVFDDVDSGQISITVTFQRFDRTKALIKSVLLSRGKANDAESRQAVMTALTGELCQRTATVDRVERNGFIFDLEECRIQERDITCELLVTNNEEDRDLVVQNYFNGTSTRMYDDESSETLTTRIFLARKASNSTNVQSTLISGRPAPLVLHFEGTSSKATVVTSLVLECWESEHEVNFQVKFSNIDLKR